MNAVSHPVKSPATFSFQFLIRFLGGALLGAAVGFAFIKMLLAAVPRKDLHWPDLMALWLSIVFLLFGFVLTLVSSNRKRLAATLEGPEAVTPATDDEVRSARRQAAVLALAGLMLLLPLLSLRHAHTWVAGLDYAAVAALFAVQTVLNVRLWKSSDEFARQVLLMVAAGTFAIGQSMLFLWAAAERLGLVPALSSWGAITVLMSIYLVVTALVGARFRR